MSSKLLELQIAQSTPFLSLRHAVAVDDVVATAVVANICVTVLAFKVFAISVLVKVVLTVTIGVVSYLLAVVASHVPWRHCNPTKECDLRSIIPRLVILHVASCAPQARSVPWGGGTRTNRDYKLLDGAFAAQATSTADSQVATT